MPAKNLARIDKEGIYVHIYNKGIENRNIFNDEKDYKIFLDFLKDYLSAPKDPNNIKKDFTVHGRKFRGTPHMPKNYLNKVELIAYSLKPNHFHLLLHQVTRGSLENFIRSLCTRYSMYFNKKYDHTGSLFEGPYKSILINDTSLLPHLTRYLHHNSDYCSYPEYLGKREASWVKPKFVLSFFEKGTQSYEAFVAKYGLDKKGMMLIDGITFDSDKHDLEGRNLASNEAVLLESDSDLDSKTISNMPHFLTASIVVFLLLSSIGIWNIEFSEAKNSKLLTENSQSPIESKSTPTPAVLSETEEAAENSEDTKPKEATPEAQPELKSEKSVTVKIEDGAESVNIRKEPTTSSEIIGQANDGQVFEFVSIVSGWYEVKLDSQSTGFIFGTYIKEETNNE